MTALPRIFATQKVFYRHFANIVEAGATGDDVRHARYRTHIEPDAVELLDDGLALPARRAGDGEQCDLDIVFSHQPLDALG
jgi:hypothetical protein